MGRQDKCGNENQDRIILDSSDGTADAGDFFRCAPTTDVGFFINTEDGTGEVPDYNTALADDAVTVVKS